MARHKMSRTAVVVAHHKHIDMHSLEIAQGVEQTFTLDRSRGADIDIKHIGRQAFGGQLKSGTSTGTGFEKQVNDGFTAQ